MASAKSILMAAGQGDGSGPKPGAPATRGPLWLAAVLVGAFAFWLLSRPFTFVENDGQLYAFLALAWGDPHRLASDLFIKFGSQDSYSIFSPIYGALIRVFGLSSATLGLLIIGAVVWLAGCWRLARTFVDPNRAALVVVVFCVFHITYGGFSTLYLSEAFLTSRIYAEAFILIGLAELGRGSWPRGAPFFILAAAFHPLMALGGLAVAGLWESFRRPWLLALGAIAVFAGVALALGGVTPFDRLTAVMDRPWLSAVEHRNGFVFLANWTARDWANVFAQALLVLAAALTSHGRRRQFFLAVLIAAAGGLATSWLGADLFHSVLVIQLQLWRAAWPLAWASVLALFALAPEARRAADWVFPALFAVALIFSEQAWPLAGLAAIGLLGVVRGYAMPPWFAKSVTALCALCFVAFFAYQAVTAMALLERVRALDLLSLSFVGLRWVVALAIAPFFVIVLLRSPSTLPVFAGLLIILSGLTWDQRTPWQRYIMTNRTAVTSQGPVLWSQEAAPTWFLLRAPAWLTLQQASGLLFSRPAALTWVARLPLTRGIVRQTPWRPDEALTPCAQADPPLTTVDIRSICAGADHPGLVILERPTAGPPAQEFSTPVDRVTLCRTGDNLDARRSRRFYIYRCGG